MTLLAGWQPPPLGLFPDRNRQRSLRNLAKLRHMSHLASRAGGLLAVYIDVISGI
jgi:hypothetical protein